MLAIRLQRVGRKNDPSFRMIVIDSKRAAKKGVAVEILGSYNPRQKKVALKSERIKYWLSVGAKTSETAQSILVKQGVLTPLETTPALARPKGL